MKLYQVARAPNPRRVTIYLAEKGISLERIEVNVAQGEHKSPDFLAMNPAGQIPVLQLDNGSYLPESAAIVEYLEELHPDPPMIGRHPAERARVRALERIGNDLIVCSALMFKHRHPYFAALVKQQPAVAEAVAPVVEQLVRSIEAHLGEHRFLAGERPTIADCTVFALFQTCREVLGEPLDRHQPRLRAWYERFAERPSARYHTDQSLD